MCEAEGKRRDFGATCQTAAEDTRRPAGSAVGACASVRLAQRDHSGQGAFAPTVAVKANRVSVFVSRAFTHRPSTGLAAQDGIGVAPRCGSHVAGFVDLAVAVVIATVAKFRTLRVRVGTIVVAVDLGGRTRGFPPDPLRTTAGFVWFDATGACIVCGWCRQKFVAVRVTNVSKEPTDVDFTQARLLTARASVAVPIFEGFGAGLRARPYRVITFAPESIGETSTNAESAGPVGNSVRVEVRRLDVNAPPACVEVALQIELVGRARAGGAVFKDTVVDGAGAVVVQIVPTTFDGVRERARCVRGPRVDILVPVVAVGGLKGFARQCW